MLVLIVKEEQPPHSLSSYHLEVVLSPLRLLRGVGKVDIRDVKGDSPNTQQAAPDMAHITPPDLSADLQSELSLLVKGKTPVIHVFKKFGNLLEYAQCFEYNSQYKKAMIPKVGEFRELESNMADIFEGEESDPEDGYRPEIAPHYVLSRADSAQTGESSSPFKQEWHRLFCVGFHQQWNHPVEHGLIIASCASETNDDSRFRVARKDIVEYLEPQYQRIVSSSINLTTFIKDFKKPDDLFDSRPFRDPWCP